MSETFDDLGGACARVSASLAAHLVVQLECDRPLAGSARYSLEGIDLVSIGRGDKRSASRNNKDDIAALQVRLPGRSLSQEHARLVRVGTSWALEDLSSRNGTFLNGKRIERAVLDGGDLIEVGHTFLRVSFLTNTRTGAPRDLDSADTLPNELATLEPSLADQLETLRRIAPSVIPVPILVLGDSGTGKEVLARWLHAQADRQGDFVPVNCGAIPPGLVESTLFGHARGAFSGAVRDEPGFVRSAHQGTLFLDEIADLPKASQAALLRVLQDGEVVPVGTMQRIRVDVRLVAATHRNLEEMVRRGEFREDLFARIAGFTVRLPRLCERPEDFGLLVSAVLAKLAPRDASRVVFAPDAGRALLAYDWPLNIRELEQCLAVSLALAEDGRLELAHLPKVIGAGLESLRTDSLGPLGTINARDEQLRLELLRQLSRHRGNLAEVAREMGKARMQVHRWCRRFGVDPKTYRSPKKA